MSSKKQKNNNRLLLVVKYPVTKIYTQVVTRLFTIPSLFLILCMYTLAVHLVHPITWFTDENASLFGQSANYMLGDKNFYGDYIPRLWLSIIALVSVIESSVYKYSYSNKISFPRFLYAYKCLLVVLTPLWAIFISIIFLDIRALWVIPATAGLLIILWPLLNAEYALYVIAEKYLTDHKITEKQINQRARAPWVAMKDLW